MNIFNGEKPHLTSAKARRAVDIESAFDKYMPEERKRLNSILEKGWKVEDEFFTSSRGLSLGTRSFIPPASKAVNTAIVFLHGYTDNLRWGSMRTMMSLAEHGFFVTGIEHEGHGLSDTTSGLFVDINLVVQDTHEFVSQQQNKFNYENWFLFGESLGGMVSILESIKAAKTDDVKLRGMVLIAPMCKIADTVKPHPAVIQILRLASFVLPTLSAVPTAMNEELVFKTKEIIEKQKKDPVRYVGRPRLSTALTMYNSTVWLEENMDQVTLPFIVLHGKADVVTPHEGSQDLFNKSIKVAKSDKKIILPNDGWHALLHCEPKDDMASFWKSIVSWVKEKSK